MNRMVVLLSVLAFASTSHAITRTWDGGAGSFSWHDAANWNPDGVPQPADDVVIAVDGPAITVVHSSGSSAVHSVSCSENLTISSSSVLTINSTSTIDGILTVTFPAATMLDGPGDLTINGALNWIGGRIQGSGLLLVGSRATFALSGVTKTLSRPLQVDGVATWTSGALNFSGGTMTNNGAFNIASDAILTATGVAGSNLLHNTGLFTKSGNGPASFVATGGTLPFDNSGSLEVSGGSLALKTGGSHSGSFAITNAAATLELNGTHVLSSSASIANQGVFKVSGGSTTCNCIVDSTGSLTMTGGVLVLNDSVQLNQAPALSPDATVVFNGPLTIPSNTFSLGNGTVDFGPLPRTFDNLEINGGTIQGSGDIVVNSHMTCIAALKGSGQVIVAEGATLDIGPARLHRTFVNNGVATMMYGPLYFSGGMFINNGSMTINANGLITFENLNDSPPGNLFINNGTIVKQGEGTARILPGPPGVQIVFNNNGAVDILESSFEITGGSHTGDFNLFTDPNSLYPAALSFTYGDTVLSADASISGGSVGIDPGAGTFTCNGAIDIPAGSQLFIPRGTVVLNGPLEAGGAIRLPFNNYEASLTLNGPTALQPTASLELTWNQTLNINNSISPLSAGEIFGIIGGDSDFSISGTVDWGGGLMTGSGRLVVLDGGVLNMTVGELTLGRDLENNGTINLVGIPHNELPLNDATIVNNGTLNAALGEYDVKIVRASGTVGVHNVGTINKSGPKSLSFSAINDGVPFDNDGVVNVHQGLVQIEAGGAGSGVFVIDPNSMVKLLSDYQAGAVNVSGALSLTSQAQLALSDSYTQSPSGQLQLAFSSANRAAITCDGDISLAGALGATFLPPPPAFTIVPLLTSANGSVIGTFSSIALSPPGTIQYEKNSVTWTTHKLGDVNGDYIVNTSDLLAVINSWGNCPVPPASCLPDQNGDGIVNSADLLIVINNWGMN